MTDDTQPEAMDLADWLEAVGGGPRAKRCAALLREQPARFAELEAQLEAVGAGGVQALSAAPAGFVPVAAFDRLHAHAESLAARVLAASPTPPAEQQAQPGAVYAELPKRRRQFLCTKCGSGECEIGTINEKYPPCKCGYLGFAEDLDFNADEMRDFADRTHALRMQAAPKAAPTRTALPEGWTDCTIEFGNDGPEVVAYGPKRMMTRLAKWLGKYFAQVIADAATKPAPQQEAQEPATVPYQKLTNEIDQILSDPDTELSIGAKRALLWVRTWVSVPLWTTPQPAPAPLSEQDEDAAMYRWLRAQHEDDSGELRCCVYAPNDMLECLVPVGDMPGELDAFIRAALAAQGDTP